MGQAADIDGRFAELVARDGADIRFESEPHEGACVLLARRTHGETAAYPRIGDPPLLHRFTVPERPLGE